MCQHSKLRRRLSTNEIAQHPAAIQGAEPHRRLSSVDALAQRDRRHFVIAHRWNRESQRLALHVKFDRPLGSQ
jgi:hypothetical protein